MQGWFIVLKGIQPYAIGIVFILIYVAEHLIPQRNELIDHRHDLRNIIVGLFNLLIAGLGGYALQQCLTLAEHFGIGLLLYLPIWAQLILGFPLSDLLMYWWHRANHQISFLWQFHRFHHTDEKLNATSAVRFHTIELMLSYFIKIPVFVVLGISPLVIIVYSLIFLPVVILHHSNIRIGIYFDQWLRRFVVSPRMHRIHHSDKICETNSNYSSVLPYWDMLFKSYRNTPDEEINFGLKET